MKRSVAVAALLAGALSLTGCTYDGVNSLSLPGTVGTNSDSYQVTVQLADAANMVPNTPVLVNDIEVGTVTKVGLDDWTPTLTLSIKNGVELPKNAVARLGQTSLLGSKHIELAAPVGIPAQGKLSNGDVIPQSRAGRFPDTEDVLASTSLLLNGGGLQHAHVITSELNRALGGREDNWRGLLNQLNDFTGGLDKQKGDIVSAFDGLDRLSSGLAAQKSVIESALQTLPQGLRVLDEEEPDIRKATHALGNWGDELEPLSDGGTDDLEGVFREMEPVLNKTADSGDSLVRSLDLFPFIVFPSEMMQTGFRGDWVNFDITLDLTLGTLDKSFLGGTPFEGDLASVERALRNGTAGGALQAGNPLQLPALGAGQGQPQAPRLPTAGPTAGKPEAPSSPGPIGHEPVIPRLDAPVDPGKSSPHGGLLTPLTPKAGG
jgi:phospholipid/cholesterol/gamma-HCH transport system substrate-binding protein